MVEANRRRPDLARQRNGTRTDSYKDVREIDILEDKKGEDPTRRIQKSRPDAARHQGA